MHNTDKPGRGAWRQATLLAFVALATVAILGAGSELVARALFRESATSTMQCLVANDPSTGVRGIPNSDCTAKIPESPLVQYHFNACGFRTAAACSAKAPGAYRIVLIGSSSVLGMHVAEAQSFAARLPAELSRRLGRRVEVFNEGMQWGTPASLALRTRDMLAVHPDLILWAATPLDITNSASILPYIPGVHAGVDRTDPADAGAPLATPTQGDNGWLARHGGVGGLTSTGWTRLVGMLDDTRTAYMLKHLLYLSDSQYLDHALAGTSNQVDYLRDRSPPSFARSLRIFGDSLETIVTAGRQVGVPVAVTLIPSRAQYIMAANERPHPGFKRDALSRQLRPIILRHGAAYADSLEALHPVTASTALFYPVDEHMTARGHAWLTGLIADALVRQGALRGADASDASH